jgi:hypothetical protein
VDERSPLDAALEDALAAVRGDPGLRELLRAARAWGVQPGPVCSAGARRRRSSSRSTTPAALPGTWSRRGPLVDVALALALQRVDAETCDGCGHPLAESTDPANEGRYLTDLPVRCHACTTLGYGTEPYQESHQPQALRFGVHLKPAREDARVV